jgi:hypothetical protein
MIKKISMKKKSEKNIISNGGPVIKMVNVTKSFGELVVLRNI